MWVAKSGSIATLATGFFYYLTNFFPSFGRVFSTAFPCRSGPTAGRSRFRYGQLFAMALILSLAWLNYYGVKLGGNVQVAVTMLKGGADCLYYHRRTGLSAQPTRRNAAPAAPLTIRGLLRRAGGGALGLRRVE